MEETVEFKDAEKYLKEFEDIKKLTTHSKLNM